MKVHCLLSDDMAMDLVNSVKPVEDIGTVLDTIDHMNRYTTSYCHGSDMYYVQCEEEDFSNWLYSKPCDPELVDLKKELMIRIEKSRELGDEEYEEMIERIVSFNIMEELLLSISKTQKEGLFVWTKGSYFDKKRWYLDKYVDCCNFVQEAQECFPNLFFHENVAHSMNTLRVEYKREKSYIIAHLTALNDFQPRFSQLLNQGISFLQISREFGEANNGIECSPQADRESARKLDFLFETDEGISLSLRCELHTKLKWNDMNHEKQDRIYFHPGDRRVSDGKVLIVHIGKHL